MAILPGWLNSINTKYVHLDQASAEDHNEQQ